MTLPFGKYKGLELDDPEIPNSYIEWLEEQPWLDEWCDGELADEVAAELKHRIAKRTRPGAGRIRVWKDDKKNRFPV
jgi:uncharacterized protein (DUF3820 family)